MHTTEHLSSMGDLYNGLRNFLEFAPPEHLEALALLLREYTNKRCHEELHTYDGFPTLMIEVGALYGMAAESVDRQPEEFQGILLGDDGEHRRSLIELAVCWGLKLRKEEVHIAYTGLFESMKKFPPEEGEEPKPVAVEAKPKRKARKARPPAKSKRKAA